MMVGKGKAHEVPLTSMGGLYSPSEKDRFWRTQYSSQTEEES
jgi:hypothetical protein